MARCCDSRFSSNILPGCLTVSKMDSRNILMVIMGYPTLDDEVRKDRFPKGKNENSIT
jgi:hypothetical protein